MKAKKILSMLLAVLMVVAMIPMAAISAGAANTGMTGTGTEADPYVIWDLAGWAKFVKQSRTDTFEGKYIELGADIDFVDQATYQKALERQDRNQEYFYITKNGSLTYDEAQFDISRAGVGMYEYAQTRLDNTQVTYWFSGNFDGKGYALKNLEVKLRTDNGYIEGKAMNGYGSFGIFGAILNASIKNVKVVDAEVHMHTGGTCGLFVAYACGDNLIENVTIDSTYYETTNDRSGFILRQSTYNTALAPSTTVTVKDCTVTNSRMFATSGDWRVQGVVGYAYRSNIVVDGLTYINNELQGGSYQAVVVGHLRGDATAAGTLTVKGDILVQAARHIAGKKNNYNVYIGRTEGTQTSDTTAANLIVKDYYAEGFKQSLSLGGDISFSIKTAISTEMGANGYGFYIGDERVLAEKDVVTVPVSAKDANTLKTAKFFYVNAEGVDTFVDELTYENIGVKAYTDAILADEEQPAELKALVTSLNTYNTAAAAYFGDATVAESTFDYTNAIDETVEGAATGANYVGMSLLLKTKTVLRFYVELDPDVYAAELYWITDNGKGVATDNITDKGNGLYAIDIVLNADDLDEEHVISVANDDDATELIITASALTYCKNAQGGDADLVNIVNALANYNAAADAYFNPVVAE